MEFMFLFLNHMKLLNQEWDNQMDRLYNGRDHPTKTKIRTWTNSPDTNFLAYIHGQRQPQYTINNKDYNHTH